MVMTVHHISFLDLNVDFRFQQNLNIAANVMCSYH